MSGPKPSQICQAFSPQLPLSLSFSFPLLGVWDIILFVY